MKRSKFLAVFVLFSIIFNCLPIEAYTLSKEKIETPEDFNKFLNSCTSEDCKILMQTLGDEGDPTPEGIRKALVWRAYNKMTYMFRGDKEIEYHEIVQWAAEKQGIDKQHIKEYSTFQLEEEITKKFSELALKSLRENGFWDNMIEDLAQESAKALLIEGAIKVGKHVPLVQRALDYLNVKAQENGMLPIVLGATATVGVGYGIYASWPDYDKISGFIASVHLIKLKKFQ